MHCGWSNPLACTWCQPAPPRSARSGAPTPWLTQYMDTRYGGGSCAYGQERQGWMEAALRFFLISGSTAGACCSVNMLSHETRPEGNQQQTLWNPHIHRPLQNPPPRSTTTALNILDTSRFHRRRRVNNDSDVAGYPTPRDTAVSTAGYEARFNWACTCTVAISAPQHLSTTTFLCFGRRQRALQDLAPRRKLYMYSKAVKRSAFQSRFPVPFPRNPECEKLEPKVSCKKLEKG